MFFRIFFAFLFFSRAAHAVLVCYEPFNYSATGGINGANGGIGWAAGWTNSPLNTGDNPVVSGGLTLAGVASSGNKMTTIGGSDLTTGSGIRAFRRIDTTRPAVTSLVDSATGKLGAQNTSLWISFLVRLASGSNGGNGGVHLYDGIGNLNTYYDGDKINHERVFMGDRASNIYWFWGRTCGGCAYAVTVDTTVQVTTNQHLLAYRYDFTNAAVNVRMFIDPPAGTNPPPDNTAVVSTNNIYPFVFDYVEIGSANGSPYERLDFDEFRIATTFAEITPTNSPPTFSTAIATNALHFESAGVPGIFYTLQATTNFASWQPVTNGETPADGVIRIDETNALPMRAFRISWP